MIQYTVGFLIIVSEIVFGTELVDCPSEQIKFEKIVGLKPKLVVELLLYQEPHQQPVTLQCLEKCGSIEECMGFVLYYKTSACYWYRSNVTSYDAYDNIIDGNAAWFVKTCLDVQDCTKEWIFERSPGSVLIGNDIRILSHVVTRQECQQECLSETSFQCRSVKFTIGHKNGSEVVGRCVLSDTDRHLMPNSFRASKPDEEYFDNQCSKATDDSFCPFEEYDNMVLSHTDLVRDDKTKEDCEKMCQSITNFNCRGYTIWPNSNSLTTKYFCLIHSEDSKLLGPKLLLERSGAIHYEKAPCLNVTISCSRTSMSISYAPNFNFYGKLYMKGYSDTAGCFVSGRGSQLLMLQISLEAKQCGLMQAMSTINSTLFHSTMILQYNNLVQTQADRIIRVGCIYNSGGNIVVGSGINFTNDLPNQGSIVVNSSNNLPTVMMKIVDFYTREEVTETQIGQDLEFIIEVSSANDSFDVSAGHLVAMTPNSEDSILLLDDRGCPTNLNVFPSLTKVSNDTVKQLFAVFQAFKFSSSSTIRFSIMIMFCQKTCPTVDCGNYISNRIKRNTLIDTDINATKVQNVRRHDFDKIGKDSVQEMPLELVIKVRNLKDINSDKLIFGESNKLLIADYDLVTQRVCVDYTLFIALVILWIFILVILVGSAFLIIHKYKMFYKNLYVQHSMEELNKNFGLGYSNLENRRVHFATDTGLN